MTSQGQNPELSGRSSRLDPWLWLIQRQVRLSPNEDGSKTVSLVLDPSGSNLDV